MEGEELCFWLFLFDLEGIKSFAYISTNGIKIIVVLSQKLVSWIDFIIFFFEKQDLRRDKRPQGMREKYDEVG
jgi:hypothetical protein